MKRATILFAFILGGCAAGAARIEPPGSFRQESTPLPAALLGRDGESADHLYARLLARDCAGDEHEHVVAQVQDFLETCKADGQRECELAACDRLRNAMPHRCLEGIATR